MCCIISSIHRIFLVDLLPTCLCFVLVVGFFCLLLFVVAMLWLCPSCLGFACVLLALPFTSVALFGLVLCCCLWAIIIYVCCFLCVWCVIVCQKKRYVSIFGATIWDLITFVFFRIYLSRVLDVNIWLVVDSTPFLIFFFANFLHLSVLVVPPITDCDKSWSKRCPQPALLQLRFLVRIQAKCSTECWWHVTLLLILVGWLFLVGVLVGVEWSGVDKLLFGMERRFNDLERP